MSSPYDHIPAFVRAELEPACGSWVPTSLPNSFPDIVSDLKLATVGHLTITTDQWDSRALLMENPCIQHPRASRDGGPSDAQLQWRLYPFAVSAVQGRLQSRPLHFHKPQL